MNILIIAANSPKMSKGGIERYMLNFADYAVGKEDDFHFLYIVGEKPEVEKQQNVTIVSEPIIDKSYSNDQSLSGRKQARMRLNDFFEYVSNYIDQHQIQIICAENFHFSAPAGYSMMLNMISLIKNIPVVVNLHSFPTKDIHEAILRDLMWSKIICVSKSVAGDCFVKGVDPDLLVTNALGVNTKIFNPEVDRNWLRSQFGLPNETNIVLHASRILQGTKDTLESKGFKYLIEAFSRISQKDSNLALVFAIAAPPKRLEKEYNQAIERLQGYIKVYGIENKVFWKAFEPEEMPKVYAGANVFVLASENETFGQVITEAMACGTPVIATGVGGIVEIIANDYNGILINHKDVAALESNLKDLTSNKFLQQKYVKNGLETIKSKFNAATQFDALVKILKEVVLSYN